MHFNAAWWLVDRHVEAGAGDRVAYRCRGEKLTYAGLQRETRRAVAALGDLGVGPGDRVLMVVADEPAFPAFFLGAMRMGAVPVPVSTMLKPADVALLAADADARGVVVSDVFARSLPASLVIDGEWRRGGGAAAPESAVAATTAESPGFWLYTSGTTGRPKGAVHRHGDIEAVATTYGRHVLEIGPDDVCLSVAKLFFAFGLGNALFFPLSVGATAVIEPSPPTPPLMAALAAEQRPTLFFAPPGFCAALADAEVPADAFASVRATITAGETLPAEVYRRFHGRFGVEMLDGLGSTEALHIVCSNRIGDVRPGSTGRVVDGYELRLTDEHGDEITTPDTPGSLWVKGESVTRGYWNRAADNAATFVDGWCRTGDVYRRDADGYWYFVGRNSDMIKAGGIWVSPAEVEAILLEHPTVLEAAVVGGRSTDGLETTIAFVVAAAGQTVDTDALIAHCRERMASFKRPREIRILDTLPKTATGKIQRFALRATLSPTA